MLSVEDKLYILKLIEVLTLVVVLQEKARVLFEQLYPESTAGFCSKKESFFQARHFFHNLQQK